MKIEQLKRIISNLDDDVQVKLEYMPRAHEYVMEDAQGVRVENGEAVLFGEGFFEILS